MRKGIFRSTMGLIPLVLWALVGCRSTAQAPAIPTVHEMELHKLEYNNPGLLVDLDVGFKSVPLPMDFDGDGDLDLLVSETGSYVEAGVFYFENVGGTADSPIFRPGVRLSSPRRRAGFEGMLEVSRVGNQVDILTADEGNCHLLIYKNVPENVFWNRQKVTLPVPFPSLKAKFSRWKLLDFDHDGRLDLLCAMDIRSGGQRLLFFKNSGTNQKPRYQKPEEIRLGNWNPSFSPLQLEPLFADFDRDGDFDYLAVGPYARFVYFENVGTPTHYRFAPGKWLTYRGTPIQLESHYGSATKPTIIDWNGDGFLDILAGDEDGKVSFLKNTGQFVDGVPQFLPPHFFRQEAKYVDFGALAAPRVFDWDGDGLADILCGDGAGFIGFIKNLGGGAYPKWAKPEKLKADGQVIRILPPKANWGYTTIGVGDWDMDGLPDILVNHYDGNVLWFQNVGTRRHPRLHAAGAVQVEWKGKPKRPAWVPGKAQGKELLAPWRTSPLITDFNRDGLNDLVMLDYAGYLAVYLRYRAADGKLRLGPPERRFVYPDGTPVLLNGLPGGHSGRLKITLTDWDGDGDPDLIFSSKPAVDWMRNEGRKNGRVILRYMGRVVSRTLMGHTDGPTTPDWNRDGIPDLLVGTETGAFYYWLRPRFDLTTTMTTVGRQKPASYPYFKR